MAKCWRCGGGKTITMTTTGTHVLPCPTCGGSGASPLAGAEGRAKVADVQPLDVESLATAKPSAAGPLRTGSKVA
jgi:hypothetical protein